MEEGGRSVRQRDVAPKTGWSDEIDGYEAGQLLEAKKSSPLQPPKRVQLCSHHDFTPVRLF